MANILKCPLCKEDPVELHRGYDEAYNCCGVEIISIGLWNQYSVAIELAKAIVWHADEMNNEEDTYGDQAAIAARHVEDLEKKVLEVFGK